MKFVTVIIFSMLILVNCATVRPNVDETAVRPNVDEIIIQLNNDVEIDMRTRNGMLIGVLALGYQTGPVPYEEDEKEWFDIANAKCNEQNRELLEDNPDTDERFILWGKNPDDPKFFLCVPNTTSKKFAQAMCKVGNYNFVKFKENNHIVVCRSGTGT